MLRTLLLVMLLGVAVPAFGQPLLSARLQIIANNNLHPSDLDLLTTRNMEAGVSTHIGFLFANVDFPLARAKQPRDFKLRFGIEVPLIK